MNNMDYDAIINADVADVAKFLKEHNAFFWGIDREQTKEINKYAQAMKLLGYQEGLKKGKSIGSRKTYNHFLKQEHWENKIPYEDVKHGHWEESKCLDDCFWVCSCCKFPSQAVAAPKLYKYCPNCGARMDGEV